MTQQPQLYIARIIATSIIAAFSLVGNSVEGVIAAMLISPLGNPINSLVPHVIAGRNTAVLREVGAVVASGALLFGVGAAVRMWDTRHGPKLSTVEMEKRNEPFDAINMLTYASLIGFVVALNSSATGPMQRATTNDRALTSVGLAIAIALAPPIVNAGIVFADRFQTRAASARSKKLVEIGRNLSLSLINMVGLIIGGTVYMIL